MGYHQAGFEVIGVDLKPQPRYPFEFHQADALTYPLEGFDVIHASPPCQGYSIMRNLPWLRDKVYPLLLTPTRERLLATGKPYIIENVAGARYRPALPEGLKAGWLCGQMFGLPLLRHRYFETNWFWLAPAHGKHWGSVRNGRTLGSRARDIVTMPVSMSGGPERHFRANGARKSAANIGHAAGFELAKEAMGIDWMRRDELTQAIPPVMTRYLGTILLVELRRSCPN